MFCSPIQAATALSRWQILVQRALPHVRAMAGQSRSGLSLALQPLRSCRCGPFDAARCGRLLPGCRCACVHMQSCMLLYNILLIDASAVMPTAVRTHSARQQGNQSGLAAAQHCQSRVPRMLKEVLTFASPWLQADQKAGSRPDSQDGASTVSTPPPRLLSHDSMKAPVRSSSSIRPKDLYVLIGGLMFFCHPDSPLFCHEGAWVLQVHQHLLSG